MAKRELALNPGMGESIINHLSALGQLPQSGFLAGQSVSSAIFELFADDGEGMVVYNDLDVFCEATDKDTYAVKKAKRTLQTVQFQDYAVHHEYGHLHLEVTGAYDIVRSHRAGLVNTIAFDNLSYGWRLSQLQSLLQGFDLNCTQVGVSLATRRLEWTPAFERFAKTRQLQISNVQTPHHTAMRWFKKRRDLPGAYGRDDEAMELVSLLSYAKGFVGDGQLREREHVRWRFGAKNAALYEEFQRKLGPYFELAPDGAFFHLRPNQRPDEDIIALAKGYPTRLIAEVFSRIRAPQQAAKRARVCAIVRAGPTGRHRALSMSLASYLCQGDAYLRGNLAIPSVHAVDAFAMSRRVLVPYLWRLSAAEQVAEYRAWASLERRFGHWIYGFVEARLRRYLADGMPAEAWESELEPYAVGLLDADTVLVDRPRFEAIFGDYTARELVTAGELLREGIELHHCVGGYAAEIRFGRSRIIQIRHPEKQRWSTLEVAPCEANREPQRKWRVVQHMSFCNERPHEATGDIVESIVVELARDATVPNCVEEPDRDEAIVGAVTHAEPWVVGNLEGSREAVSTDTRWISHLLEWVRARSIRFAVWWSRLTGRLRARQGASSVSGPPVLFARQRTSASDPFGDR